MAAREATVIVLDVGRNTFSSHENLGETSFFHRAQLCVEKILQRKIFSQPRDEVGLILIGTACTNNQLATDGVGYEHISLAFDLTMPTWQMLRILEKEIQPQRFVADWLSGVIVAMDLLKDHMAKKFKSFKIVLLTPFTSPASDEVCDDVIANLLKMQIDLIVITDNIEYFEDDNDPDENDGGSRFSQAVAKTPAQKSNESLITKLITETNGVLCSFDQALVQLIYFEKKKQRTMPWSTTLEIGTKLTINITAYIQVKDTAMETWKTDSADGECKLRTQYFLDDKELPSDRTLDLIKGYMYGKIPVAYDASLGASSTESQKGMICIGFTHQSAVTDECLAGTGSWAVVSQSGFSVSEKKFVALVAALRKSKMSMVVRYVYRNGSKPKIMALFPVESKIVYKQAASLVMVELLYAENHISVTFPSLICKRTEVSQQQYDAVDALIDSMDLMNAFDDDNSNVTEAFVHNKVLNPTLQYTYRVITQRALHPQQPVPMADKDLLEMLDVPIKLRRSAADKIKSVKELFPLEPQVRLAKKQQLFDKMQLISSTAGGISGDAAPLADAATTDTSVDLVEVGTVTPAEDFAELFRRGEKFATLCQQMQRVITDLVLKSIVCPTLKVSMALMIYREEAKVIGAFRYNEWVVEFKKMLLGRQKMVVWDEIVVREGYGLITADESETSTVTAQEAKDFYALGLSAGAAGASMIDDEDDDIDDLIGNM